MRVYDMVCQYLKNSKRDGLVNEWGQCACLLSDLVPCNEISEECEGGYKVECSRCIKREDCEYYSNHDEPSWLLFTKKDFCDPEYEKGEQDG